MSKGKSGRENGRLCLVLLKIRDLHHALSGKTLEVERRDTIFNCNNLAKLAVRFHTQKCYSLSLHCHTLPPNTTSDKTPHLPQNQQLRNIERICKIPEKELQKTHRKDQQDSRD
ncbi:hypothetical protein ACSQ67_010725 [Phaseolus vulgaris]